MKQTGTNEQIMMPVICTGHVMEKDAEIIPLIAWDYATDSGYTWLLNTPYGWIFRISSAPDNWSEELKKSGISSGCISNFQKLTEAGYSWVQYDCGAPVNENLQHWDW